MQLRARVEIHGIATKKKVELFTASKNIKRAPFSTSGTFWSELHFNSLYIWKYVQRCWFTKKNGRREISKFCKCIAYSDWVNRENGISEGKSPKKRNLSVLNSMILVTIGIRINIMTWFLILALNYRDTLWRHSFCCVFTR